MADLTLNADVKLNITTSNVKGVRKQIESELSSNPVKVKLDVEGTAEATKKVKESISKLKVEAANTTKSAFNAVTSSSYKSYFKEFTEEFTKKSPELQKMAAYYKQAAKEADVLASANNKINTYSGKDFFKNFDAQFKKSPELQKMAAYYSNIAREEEKAASEAARFSSTQTQQAINFKHLEQEANSYYTRYRENIQNNASLSREWNDLLSKIGSNPQWANSKEASLALEQLKSKSRAAGVEIDTLGQKLKNLFGQHFATAVVMAGIAALRRSLQLVYQNVVELDKAVVDLQIASGKTRTEIQGLMSDYSKLGKEIGATTVEVAKGADSWIRQGFAAAEADKLIRDTMMLSKLGQIESDEATQALTSTMRGYKLSVDEVSGALDKYVAVDMVAAVTSGDVSKALSETAASADLAGVSLDRIIGYITSVMEVTQGSPEEIGNFFKSMFARMGNIKAGRLIDPETEESLSDVETVLDSLGIKLRKNETDWRSFQDVLDDVSSRWDSYSDTQQRAIANAFGMTRQQERFLVLMGNYGKALEYSEVAANSSGTAIEKYGAYTEGLEARLNALTASFESLSVNILDSDFVKGVVDALSWLTTGLDDFLKLVDKIPGASASFNVLSGVLGGVLGAKGEGIINTKGNSNEYALYLSNRVDAQAIKLRGSQNIISPKRSWKRQTATVWKHRKNEMIDLCCKKAA